MGWPESLIGSDILWVCSFLIIMFSVTSALHRAVQASEVADASVAPARRYAKVQDNKSKFGTSSRFYDHEGTSNQVRVRARK